MLNSENIKNNDSLVKCFLNTVSQLVGENIAIKKCVIDGGKVQANFAQDFKNGQVENCPFNMPRSFTGNPTPKEKGQKKDYTARFSLLFQEAEKGKISDESIKKYSLREINNVPYIFNKGVGEMLKVFEGRDVFSGAYNRYMSFKINMASQFLAQKYKHNCFITLTYKYKKYGKNQIKACKIFNEQVKKFQDFMRRKYKARAIVVMEATKRGYPHAHILFFSDIPFDEKWEKIEGNKKIHYGEFFNACRERVASPKFDITKPENEHVSTYLAKYLSKYNTRQYVKCCEEDGTLTSTDRKELLTVLMFKIAGVRRVRFPRDKELTAFLDGKREEYSKKMKEKKMQKKGNSENNPAHEDSCKQSEICNISNKGAAREEFFAPHGDFDLETRFPTYEEIGELLSEPIRRKAFLIEICTKLSASFSCFSRVSLSNLRVLREQIGDFDKISDIPSEKLEEIRRPCTNKVGCYGCIVSKFVEYILFNEREFFAPHKTMFEGLTGNLDEDKKDEIFNLENVEEQREEMKNIDTACRMFYTRQDFADICGYYDIFIPKKQGKDLHLFRIETIGKIKRGETLTTEEKYFVMKDETAYAVFASEYTNSVA